MAVVAVGEIVVAHGSHSLPFVGDEPIVLGEHVPQVLLAHFALQVGVVEIIVHVVGANGEHVSAFEGVVVEPSYGVLHVAVVAYVESCDALEVRLVVLVEGVARLHVVPFRQVPIHAQPAREVAVAFGLVGRPHRLPEEVSGASREVEVAVGAPHQLVFEVHRLVAIHGCDDARHRALGAVHIVVVRTVEVGREHIVPMLSVQSEGRSVALLVVLGVACVHIERQGLLTVFRDDVDHSARGIASIQGRGRTLHDLYALHVVHAQSGEVHVVHGLASQPLAVHEEEHSLAAEAREVEVRLLVHGIRELHAGKFLLQEVLHVGGVEPGNLLGADHACLYGRVLQKFRRARARHHHLAEIKLSVGGVGGGILGRCRLPRGGGHQYGE